MQVPLNPFRQGVEAKDEYQSCSGIGRDANKKTVVERKDPAACEAHLYLRHFAARDPEGTPVVPCYKATTLRFLLQDYLSKHDIHQAKNGAASALSGSIPVACQNLLGRSSAHATENKGGTQRKAVACNYRRVG
jgi:hypothetical protein